MGLLSLRIFKYDRRMYQLLKKLIFLLPPETAHVVCLNIYGFMTRWGLGRYPQIENPIDVCGLHFPNRIGLAAGLDKNGQHVRALSHFGAGFLEVGSVTPQARLGNPQPRLFRLPEYAALINRIGLANEGIDAVIQRLQRVSFSGVLGVNIAKGLDSDARQGIEDYQFCFQKVAAVADYVTVNISCPHEHGVKAFHFGDKLKQLLLALKTEQQRYADSKKYVPIFLKVSPDLTPDEFKQFAASVTQHGIDGIIAVNTSNQRPEVSTHPLAQERGGLSGAPLYPLLQQALTCLTPHLPDKFPIIALGGIHTPEQVHEVLSLGASLIQVYTGLIYQGPQMISQLASVRLRR